jgi:hypothetical protein
MFTLSSNKNAKFSCLNTDMKNGFYEKLESELQGSRNTYYVGGLMAFELTERNSSYAMALMCKNFANKNDLPVFPYTKVIWHLYIITWY